MTAFLLQCATLSYRLTTTRTGPRPFVCEHLRCVAIFLRTTEPVPTHINFCLSVWHNYFLTLESPPKNVVRLFRSTCQNQSLCYCKRSPWFASGVSDPLRLGQLLVFIVGIDMVKCMTTFT